MTSLANMCATRFLYLADSFLNEQSPLDAIHCAELAVKSDPSLWEQSGVVMRAATELEVLPLERPSDDLVRLRWHVEMLEATTSNDNNIRKSLPKPALETNSIDTRNDKPLPDSLRKTLANIGQQLKDRGGDAIARAIRTIRDLLGESALSVEETVKETPPVPDASESTSVICFDEFLSLEHEAHNLANDLYKTERFEDAVVFYDVALEIRPDLLETFFNRGLAHTRLRDYDKAEADLNEAIRLNKNLSEVWYTRGLVHEYKLQYDAAIADYDEALRIDPAYRKAEDQRRVAREKRDSKSRGPSTKGSNDDYDGVVHDFAPYRVNPDCRLSQVGDHATIKREFRKILTYLSGGRILSEWGAELPRGVLLYGETGVGKTHLARALAGEADCPYYAPPISLLFDMYVGNSEKNLRNLFRAASQHEEAIIFFDEIEAIASLRKESRQNHEPWQARLAACFLEEMDNLPNRNSRVIVVGATNSLDAVDPCFLRPGRFTYVIEVKPPKEKGLVEIMLVCLEVAARRATRNDFLDAELEKSVLSPRNPWIEQAFQHEGSGLVHAARIAAKKKLVGDDVREIVRRIIDERVIAGMDGLDLGPVTTSDLVRHLEEYRPMRTN